MQFWIDVEHNWRRYRYLVNHAPIDNYVEHFTISATNKSITIESNRPFFRKRGLKHKTPDYKLLIGDITNRSFLEKIFEALQEKMDKLEG